MKIYQINLVFVLSFLESEKNVVVYISLLFLLLHLISGNPISHGGPQRPPLNIIAIAQELR